MDIKTIIIALGIYVFGLGSGVFSMYYFALKPVNNTLETTIETAVNKESTKIVNEIRKIKTTGHGSTDLKIDNVNNPDSLSGGFLNIKNWFKSNKNK